MTGVHQTTLRKWGTHAGWRTAGRTLSDFVDFYNRNVTRKPNIRKPQTLSQALKSRGTRW